MSSSKVKVSGDKFPPYWKGIVTRLLQITSHLLQITSHSSRWDYCFTAMGWWECTDSERKGVIYIAACVQFMLGKTSLASSGNFNRPGRAAIQVCVCVCLDNNFQIRWPLIYILDTLVQLDTILFKVRRSRLQVTVQGNSMKNVPLLAMDARYKVTHTLWSTTGQHQSCTQHLHNPELFAKFTVLKCLARLRMRAF